MNSIIWQPLEKPLTPVGMIVLAEQRKFLINTLINFDSERLLNLRGSFNQNVIIILGDEHYLPWIPGVNYLGIEKGTTNLLTPTHLTPSIPIDWLDRAIQKKFGQGQFAINHRHDCVYNVSKILNISIDKLKELRHEAP